MVVTFRCSFSSPSFVVLEWFSIVQSGCRELQDTHNSFCVSCPVVRFSVSGFTSQSEQGEIGLPYIRYIDVWV